MDNDSDHIGKFNGRDSHGKFISEGNKGRPPGSKNQTRRAIKDFVTTQSENLESWFESLPTAKDKLEYYIRLLPYTISRLQGISVVDDDGDAINEKTDLSQWPEEDLRMLILLHERNKRHDN